MTILSAAQDAIARLVGRRPSAVVSSQDEINVEMTALAQEAAVDIAKAHEWQQLVEFHTIVSDGTSTAYPFPEDYDRMLQASDVYDPNTWAWNYTHIASYGNWLRAEHSGFGMLTPGAWTIRKNQFHFLPAPSAGAAAVFPYISRNIFLSASGTPKQRIENDTDSFVLDERLLTLALIWRWKALKEMNYQEDMRNYEIALSQEMSRDKGSTVLRENGRVRFPNAVTAWPWALGGEG